MVSGFASLFGSCYAVPSQKFDVIEDTIITPQFLTPLTPILLGSKGAEKVAESLDSVSTEDDSESSLLDSSDFQAKISAQDSTSSDGSAHLTQKHKRAIIFDWDDTLFPTSYWLHEGRNRAEAIRMKQNLMQLGRHVREVLTEAKKFGAVYIITNSAPGWVEQSTLRFMPATWSALQGVRIISARARYERMFPGEQAAWKRRAFMDLRGSFDSTGSVDIISIGDMPFEILAARALGTLLPQAFVKTVRFETDPTPEDIIRELHYLASKWNELVTAKEHLHFFAR